MFGLHKKCLFVGGFMAVMSQVQAAPIEFQDYLKITRGGVSEAELIQMAGNPDYVTDDRVTKTRRNIEDAGNSAYKCKGTDNTNTTRTKPSNYPNVRCAKGYIEEYSKTKDMTWYSDGSGTYTTTVTVRDGMAVGAVRKRSSS